MPSFRHHKMAASSAAFLFDAAAIPEMCVFDVEFLGAIASDISLDRHFPNRLLSEHMNDYSDDRSGDLCEISLVDAQKVLRARAEVPPEGFLQEQAERFKLLGDPTRLRILHALSAEELCVCDLAALLDSSPSAVSHQLRLLRAARLVRFRKSGKMVYYTLNEPRVRTLLKMSASPLSTDGRRETGSEI